MQLKYRIITCWWIYVQIKLNSRLKEKNRDDEEIESKIIEDNDEGDKGKETNQKHKFLQLENSDDGQGTKLCKLLLINELIYNAIIWANHNGKKTRDHLVSSICDSHNEIGKNLIQNTSKYNTINILW